ncbi:MAG: CHRD domain-containing protein [Nocardioides sp.]
MNTTRRRLAITALAVAALLVAAATLSSTNASADKRSGSFSARLSGYQETPTSLSTEGSGFIRVKINERNETLHYILRYDDLEGAVTQAHIHFGAVALTGGISVWLCANPPLTPPPGTPTCPESGTISGTLDAADVVGPAAAGIEAGAFDELIDAIEAGTAYANVHSSLYQTGEIRGQLRRG